MANLIRVRCTWAGSALDGPGVSTFYLAAGTSAFAGDFQTFFQAIKALFPAGVTITVPNTGDEIDAATGALAGTWTDSGGSTTTGTGATGFIRGVGIRLTWTTNGIFSGRRVKGSTFLAPVVTGTYDSSGIPTTGTVTALEAAGAALISGVGNNLAIWSRPNNVSGNNGTSSTVVQAVLPQAVSWLRSRRV